ncbi:MULTISPECIES: hypothetical protein [unclassified Rheinheimera]|uniref:hypothetical protein n=1 Tax=unclassified Rheinheimera TaxID=115860 RepID=UPI0021B0D0BE|nr:hypothetical protein [Rheinheimera sp. 4Y26]MCT6699420.1 hypothetical protein [Rheinheimera sp. 4Y26]
MKDLVSIHDYLFGVGDVGDWEGDEELVADRINAIYHAVWQQIPDDTEVALIDKLMRDIWDQLRGSLVLIEADEYELIDWALAHTRKVLDKALDEDDADDDDSDTDVDDEEDEEY